METPAADTDDGANAGLSRTQAMGDDAGAATSHSPRVIREPLLEIRRMRADRARQVFWEALYELWRLSWFCVATASPRRQSPLQNLPRPIPLHAWLLALDQGQQQRWEDQGTQNQTDTAAAAASRPDTLSGNGRRTPITPDELAHIAGGLIKAGAASSRFDLSTGALVYCIDPEGATRIQQYLNQCVSDQRLRPGIPVSGDQAAALVARRGGVRFMLHLNPRLAELHTAWAVRALTRAIESAEAAVDQVRRQSTGLQPPRKRPRTPREPEPEVEEQQPEST